TTPPIGAAPGFVGYDSFTKGNWIGKYGSEGYALVDTTGQNSPWMTWFFPNIGSTNWQALDSDDRAFIRQIGSTNRSLGGKYSATQFDLPFNILDGRTHRVALYFVDFDGKSRNQMIQVINTDTGALIDTRTISNFNGGKYLVWQIHGNTTFRI